MNEKFLNNLLNSISVSGYEEQVQDIVTEEMKEYTDEIRRDEMQNLTCILNPENDVRIMLSAHADEIGLMISNIREDGRLQVIDRGGIVPATYPGRQVRIKTKNGEVYGVVEAYRDLFKEENLGTKHFLIDIGAKDREDSLKNVSLGDPIVPDTHIRKMKNGKFTDKTDLVYFGNLKHKSGTVNHMGDNLTGAGEGDDEQIVIDLSRVPAEYDKIVIVVNIYQAVKRKQHFGMIQNAFIRLVDARNNKEMCKYNLTENYSGMTAMIFGEIYRYNGEWKFNAVGNGTTDPGLGELCQRFV